MTNAGLWLSEEETCGDDTSQESEEWGIRTSGRAHVGARMREKKVKENWFYI
jgi:hypothetical protein